MTPEIYTRLSRASLSSAHMRAAMLYLKRRETITLPGYQAQILDDVFVRGILLTEMEKKYGWPDRSAKAIIGVLLTSLFSDPVALEPTGEQYGNEAELPVSSISEFHIKYKMTPNEALLFDALATRANRILSVQSLADYIYQGENGGPEAAERSIRVLVHKVRKKLAKAAFNGRIVNHHGFGYELQTLSDAQTQ